MEFSKIDQVLQKRIAWTPHEAQQEILDGLAQFTAICAGTRFGKTMLCAYLALRQLLMAEQHIWIIAPTYGLSEKIYAYLVKWIGNGFPNDLKKGIITATNRKGEGKIENKMTGSWIEFKSAENPTSLLGEELDLAIMDECPRIKASVWESYVYQRLTSRKGKAVFIGTPRGKGWFYREFVKGLDPKNKENASFTFTSKDNPYWGRPKSSPEEEWLKAKERLPEMVFLQEHVAKFVENATQYFRGVRKITGNTLKDVVLNHYYNFGIDVAYERDYTAFAVIDRMTYDVVYLDRMKKVPYPELREKIKNIAKRYNNARIYIDSTGVGLPVTQDLQVMGLIVDDFKFTGQSKESLMQNLATFIERKLIRIPENEILISELESITCEYTPSKRLRIQAPEGMHDDYVDALALAVWGLQKKQPPRKNPVQQELEKRDRPNIGSDI